MQHGQARHTLAASLALQPGTDFIDVPALVCCSSEYEALTSTSYGALAAVGTALVKVSRAASHAAANAGAAALPSSAQDAAAAQACCDVAHPALQPTPTCEQASHFVVAAANAGVLDCAVCAGWV